MAWFVVMSDDNGGGDDGATAAAVVSDLERTLPLPVGKKTNRAVKFALKVDTNAGPPSHAQSIYDRDGTGVFVRLTWTLIVCASRTARGDMH